MPARIMVVDDDRQLESLINSLFRGKIINGDYRFCFVSDGQQALELLSADDAIDMVLTAIDLPRMGGLELLAQLEGDEFSRYRQYGLKTIVMSSCEDIANIRTAMNLGAVDFLTRPINPKDLEITIANTLEKVARDRENQRFRRIKEAELNQVEAKYRHIFENAVEGMFQASPGGSFIDVNSAIAEMLGYATSQHLLAQINDIGIQVFAEPGQYEQFSQLIETQARVKGFEFQAKCADGSLIWVSANARAVKEPQGSLLYYDGSLIDISDRITAQEALKRSQKDLEQRVKQRTQALAYANDQMVVEVAVRKHIEQSLRQSESKLRHVFEQAPVMMISVDDRGRICDVNDKWLAETGYARAEVMYKSADFLISLQPDEPEPEFGTEFWQADHIQDIPYCYRTKDGDDIDVLIDCVATVDPTGKAINLAVVRNITAQKQAEKQLQFAMFALERLSHLVAWCRPDGQITYVNKATTKALGYAKDELLNMSISQIDSSISASQWQSHWQELKTRKYLYYETTMCRKNGSIFPVEVTANYLEFGGEEYNFVFVKDISDRKQFESALQRSNSLLKAQREVAIDGILAVDEQGRIVSFNRRFCEMWDVPEALLNAGEANRLLSFLLTAVGLPEPLTDLIERTYDDPNDFQRDEIRLPGDRIFDCYSGPVMANDGKYFGMIWFFRDITDRVIAEEALQVEKEKSERLLLNILPEPIANRLKLEQGAIADRFSQVSVLFADIVDFTRVSARMSPQELVSMLNQIFSAFDHLADQHGLEKIKTVGDAYMVASGLPYYREDHMAAIAHMALDMREQMQQFNARTGESFRMRIGINAGPVVAGVIGTKKFIYDLWGDTVNIASRMESQGTADRIQVSEIIYEELADQFDFEPRGAIEVKGRGQMTTYFLTGRKPGAKSATDSSYDLDLSHNVEANQDVSQSVRLSS
ncbi:adenylate/guanylate cyclase [Thalassoporum mexicanum PCC 7367]|uniref:adenylate/guanylate cyclase domain-containing protein n=1 Tax=Thalassoporum mexicanum TaxID=3457544 RepID=UPI00029FC00F|nr:adenylate/guanylate cyclase domain-containing protein [Pseudanabaena sp. PCC 7367]AFY70913.1 adenylate/guanylate cyclase [Pseudanabaena sp. PCC 7367]